MLDLDFVGSLNCNPVLLRLTRVFAWQEAVRQLASDRNQGTRCARMCCLARHFVRTSAIREMGAAGAGEEGEDLFFTEQ